MSDGTIVYDGNLPYCRVESLGAAPARNRYGQSGVSIQRLAPDGTPIGPPLLFSDAGARQLERLIAEAREYDATSPGTGD